MRPLSIPKLSWALFSITCDISRINFFFFFTPFYLWGNSAQWYIVSGAKSWLLFLIYWSFFPSVTALLRTITCNHTENLTLNISFYGGPSATMPVINAFCSHVLMTHYPWYISQTHLKNFEAFTKRLSAVTPMIYCLDILLWIPWSFFCFAIYLHSCQGYPALYCLNSPQGVLLKVPIKLVQPFTCTFISLLSHTPTLS